MRPSLTRYRAPLRWLLAALLMALAIHLLTSDPEGLRRLLATPPRVLGGLALLVTLNQVLMSFRFSLAVSEAGGKGVPAMTWFRLTSVGQFLNLFVPQLGNVYRGVALKREYGITYMSYASGLFAFVWLDAVTGFVTALLVIAAVDPGLEFAGYPALLWLGAVIATLTAAPFIAGKLVRAFHLGEGLAGRIQARTQTLLATVNRAFKRPSFLLRFFAVNVLSAAGHVASLWLAFGAVGASIAPSGLILFQIFVKLSNLIAITPGNLGLTELAYAALAHASSGTAEQGVAVGLLIRSVGMVTVITLGLCSGGGAILMRGRRGLSEDQAEKGAVELEAKVGPEGPIRNR